MCRYTENNAIFKEKLRLKFRAFYLRLSLSNLNSQNTIPETLTLLYLPRINGSLLEINGAKIRPDSPALVVLHRFRSAEEPGDSVYTSTDRVRVGEGVRFEVYVKEERVLKGIFRKDEDETWKAECRCAMERELAGIRVSEAEVCVAGERCGAVKERVEMVVRRSRRSPRGWSELEEIPEEREIELDGCDCVDQEMESDGEDEEEEEDGREEWTAEMEEGLGMEGVRWAVDLGIWVMCLGVGILVSKASFKRGKRGSFI